MIMIMMMTMMIAPSFLQVNEWTFALETMCWVLGVVVTRSSALHSLHRLCYAAIAIALFLMLPQASSIGHPLEPVLSCGALLCGEIVGFTLDASSSALLPFRVLSVPHLCPTPLFRTSFQHLSRGCWQLRSHLSEPTFP